MEAGGFGRKVFFHTLKKECLLNWRDISAGEVKNDIMDYIEMFYNSQRLHSFNGYLNPDHFERDLTALNGLSVLLDHFTSYPGLQ